MIVAIPPEPVAPLGDVDLFPRFLKRRCLLVSLSPCLPVSLSILEILARLVQRVPGGVVFVVADPDGVVVVDPASREQVGQRVARRIAVEIFAQLDRTNLIVAGTEPIEGTQERHAAVRIMLPAILAV